MRHLSLVVILVLTVSLASADAPRRISWTWGPEFPNAQSALGTTVVGDSVVVVGGAYWVGPRDGTPDFPG